MSESEKRIVLKDWSITTLSPYTAPEIGMCLTGTAYGHPKHQDGQKIRTSPILKVDKNIVTTESGSIYELDEPNPKFVEYCKEAGGHIPTKYNPIKTEG